MKATIRVKRAQGPWPKVEKGVRRAALAALEHSSLALEKVEVGIRLTDNAEVQELNRQYRGKDKPTNILSFAMLKDDFEPFGPPEEPVLLGDLVIAHEVVLSEARDQEKNFEDHLAHLVVHGILHLAGYDHERSPEEAFRQETMEIAILAHMGINNPYE